MGFPLSLTGGSATKHSGRKNKVRTETAAENHRKRKRIRRPQLGAAATQAVVVLAVAALCRAIVCGLLCRGWPRKVMPAGLSLETHSKGKSMRKPQLGAGSYASSYFLFLAVPALCYDRRAMETSTADREMR